MFHFSIHNEYEMNKTREFPAINASSMADIAFLLLIFFLVTTTLDMDKGISVKLPDWDIAPTTTTIHQRNILEILVNGQNELLVEGQLTAIEDLHIKAFQFIDNNGKRSCSYCKGNGSSNSSDHPAKAIISLSSHPHTDYDTYIQVYDQLLMAYHTLKNDISIQQYQLEYKALRPEQKKIIEKMYPIMISENLPNDI